MLLYIKKHSLTDLNCKASALYTLSEHDEQLDKFLSKHFHQQNLDISQNEKRICEQICP